MATRKTKRIEKRKAPKQETILLLRTCGPNGESNHDKARGFRWPLKVGIDGDEARELLKQANVRTLPERGT